MATRSIGRICGVLVQLLVGAAWPLLGVAQEASTRLMRNFATPRCHPLPSNLCLVLSGSDVAAVQAAGNICSDSLMSALGTTSWS